MDSWYRSATEGVSIRLLNPTVEKWKMENEKWEMRIAVSRI
jgi:hypothetical protein